MKIDLNNYANLSQTDRAVYREFSALTKQLSIMMDTVHNIPVEDGDPLAKEFKRGVRMAADSILKFHLPRMADRIDDIKLRRDLRVLVYSTIEKLREIP